MRKIIYILICLTIFMVNIKLTTAEYISQEEYFLDLDSTNLEFSLGEVEKNSIIRERIKIINKLDEPLTVKEARSTCECLQIYVEPQIVEKGGIFEAKITIDTIGFTQDIEEVVYILTDNMNYELIRLAIVVAVVEPQ